MKLKKKIENFIRDCNQIHNNEFDYKFVFKDFKNQRSIIRIICPEHGIFKQIASNHKRGQKCRKCRDVLRGKKSKRTKAEFLASLTNHHLDKYDYSLMKNYDNKSTEKFICPIHGVFRQSVARHLDTGGCYRCGRDKTSERNKKTFSKKDIIAFAVKANIDGDRLKLPNLKEQSYHYDTELTISCKYHGFSIITVEQLKRKTTCKECRYKGYGKKRFVRFCKENNKPVAILYKLLMWNEKESFFKIGITSNSVKSRFRKLKTKTGYSYKVLKTLVDTPEKVWTLENRLKKKNREHRYKPKNRFEGYSECFKTIEYDF